MVRRYQSPVREERSQRVRASLLDACEALLLEVPVEEVTLPAVARRAGVSKPTAYSYFPDNDALMAGFLGHLRDRIGMDHKTLAGVEPARLPAAVRDNYRRFDENARLLQRIMDSPSYERVRLSRKIDRAALAMPVWDGSALKRGLRERLGPVYMLVSPPSWRWLRETWGLSGEEAARAAAWAMSTLVTALNAEGVEPQKTRPQPAAKRAKEKRS
jgi:AcrR family transcriptional regulator